MTKFRWSMGWTAAFAVAATLALMPAAQAAPVGSQTHAQMLRQSREAEVMTALDLAPVRDRLADLGMDRAEIEELIARLDDEQLAELADRAGEIEAGGSSLPWVIAALVVMFLWVLYRYTDHWNWFD